MLVALFVGRKGDLYVLLSRYVIYHVGAFSLMSNVSFQVEPRRCEPMLVTPRYPVANGNTATGVLSGQRYVNFDFRHLNPIRSKLNI